MAYPIIAVLAGFGLTLLWLVALVALEVYSRFQRPALLACTAEAAPPGIDSAASDL